MIAAAWVCRPSGRCRTPPPDSGANPLSELAIWLGVAFSGAALAPLIVKGAVVGRVVLFTYQVALIALAVGLLVALLLSTWERTGVWTWWLSWLLACLNSQSTPHLLAPAGYHPRCKWATRSPNVAGHVETRPDNRSTSPAPDSGRALTPVEWGRDPHRSDLIHDPAI